MESFQLKELSKPFVFHAIAVEMKRMFGFFEIKYIGNVLGINFGNDYSIITFSARMGEGQDFDSYRVLVSHKKTHKITEEIIIKHPAVTLYINRPEKIEKSDFLPKLRDDVEYKVSGTFFIQENLKCDTDKLDIYLKYHGYDKSNLKNKELESFLSNGKKLRWDGRFGADQLIRSLSKDLGLSKTDYENLLIYLGRAIRDEQSGRLVFKKTKGFAYKNVPYNDRLSSISSILKRNGFDVLSKFSGDKTEDYERGCGDEFVSQWSNSAMIDSLNDDIRIGKINGRVMLYNTIKFLITVKVKDKDLASKFLNDGFGKRRSYGFGGVEIFEKARSSGVEFYEQD